MLRLIDTGVTVTFPNWLLFISSKPLGLRTFELNGRLTIVLGLILFVQHALVPAFWVGGGLNCFLVTLSPRRLILNAGFLGTLACMVAGSEKSSDIGGRTMGLGSVTSAMFGSGFNFLSTIKD